MSFLGCLIIGLSHTFSLLSFVIRVHFTNPYNRSVMLKAVDRLAVPHASLGQVRSDLAARLCVHRLCSFFRIVLLLRMYHNISQTALPNK
jgi:hypothetical protein